jgi:4-hydroxybutyrate dehydrogenase
VFNDIVQFSFPTTILFGRRAIGRLPDCLGELGVRKPLIVTDEGLVEAGLVNRVTTVLQTSGIPYGVFSGVRPDPRIEEVEGGVASFRAHACDGVIGFGGGSSLDVAKVVPVLATQDGPLTRYDILTGGNKNIRGPLPPLVLIPTTSGSGSEVGRCSVIIDPSLCRKFLVCHPLLLAKRAILDPELTVGLPPLLTAATGMDAFAHNLESLICPVFHPMCDAIALKGIEFVARYLERAVKNPGDVEARGFMMLAAMMGAVAFQKDLGATHSLAHALSSVCSIPHGLAIAMCLVPVMIYNQDVSAAGYAQVARCFGIETVGLSDREASEKAIRAVADLLPRLGIPRNLAAAGVEEGRLADVARTAFEDPCHQTNPRPCTVEDLRGLLRAAYGSNGKAA